MNQEERNDQLQRENTTLRAKLASAEKHSDDLGNALTSKEDSLIMAGTLLAAKDEEIAEKDYAIGELHEIISQLKGELATRLAS